MVRVRVRVRVGVGVRVSVRVRARVGLLHARLEQPCARKVLLSGSYR